MSITRNITYNNRINGNNFVLLSNNIEYENYLSRTNLEIYYFNKTGKKYPYENFHEIEGEDIPLDVDFSGILCCDLYLYNIGINIRNFWYVPLILIFNEINTKYNSVPRADLYIYSNNSIKNSWNSNLGLIIEPSPDLNFKNVRNERRNSPVLLTNAQEKYRVLLSEVAKRIQCNILKVEECHKKRYNQYREIRSFLDFSENNMNLIEKECCIAGIPYLKLKELAEKENIGAEKDISLVRAICNKIADPFSKSVEMFPDYDTTQRFSSTVRSISKCLILR